MTDVFAESTLCVPGKQDMNGILVKSFYCEPDRILGNHVFIDQGPGKVIAISEVGVYEETKRKFLTRCLLSLKNILIIFKNYWMRFTRVSELLDRPITTRYSSR